MLFRPFVLPKINVDQWVRVVWILFPSPAPMPHGLGALRRPGRSAASNPVSASLIVFAALAGAGSRYGLTLLNSDRSETSGHVGIFIGCNSGSSCNRFLVCRVCPGGIDAGSSCLGVGIDDRQTVRNGECGRWTAAGSVLAILGVRSEARGDARLVAVPVCRRRHAWAEAMPMARSRGCSAGPWRRGISVRADGDRQIDVRRYSDELLRRH